MVIYKCYLYTYIIYMYKFRYICISSIVNYTTRSQNSEQVQMDSMCADHERSDERTPPKYLKQIGGYSLLHLFNHFYLPNSSFERQ